MTKFLQSQSKTEGKLITLLPKVGSSSILMTGGETMVKLVYCVRRRSDVPPDEFHNYWKEKHGPLVRSFAEAIRAKKYVQSHTIDTDLNRKLAESRGMAPHYDGIAEAWWHSLEDLEEAFRSEAGREAAKVLVEDEGRFIDLSQSRIFLTEEHPIFDP